MVDMLYNCTVNFQLTNKLRRRVKKFFFHSRTRLPLPALVLAQKHVTVRAVVLGHLQPGGTEWYQGTGKASENTYLSFIVSFRCI